MSEQVTKGNFDIFQPENNSKYSDSTTELGNKGTVEERGLEGKIERKKGRKKIKIKEIRES